MADYELQSVMHMEGLRDSYVDGDVLPEDALEYGFIGVDGTEQEGVKEAWDRSEIGTREQLESQARAAEVLVTQRSVSVCEGSSILSNSAKKNLDKEEPTCNTCRNPMQAREGKFGKFYFCPCPEQTTVSDKYWQKTRIK